MHPSAIENIYKCVQLCIADREFKQDYKYKVLDIDTASPNSSYSEVFDKKNFDYMATNPSANGDTDLHTFSFDDDLFDIVICGQMFERHGSFKETFNEMVRILKPNGFLFLLTPSRLLEGRPPEILFSSDSYQALAESSNCHLVRCWIDNRGPWKEVVGIFSRRYVSLVKLQKNEVQFDLAHQVNEKRKLETKYDSIQGSRPYLEVLTELHDAVQPSNYLEIGVRNGRSLSISRCNAVGVDPFPDLKVTLNKKTRLVAQPSDVFFHDGTDPILSSKPELAFIDGMHLFEYALRDFMNIEAISNDNTIVIIDDIFPNEPQQATRERNTRVWTGDVWKFYKILEEFRPDLTLIPLDTLPSGLLLVIGLKPDSSILWDSYNAIVDKVNDSWTEVPQKILNRENIIDPNSDFYKDLISRIAEMNRSSYGVEHLKLAEGIIG